NQSLYYMIWASLINQRHDYAEYVIKKHNLIKKFDLLNNQLKFWVAYTESKNKSSGKSHVLFKKIINQNKKDFYYYISRIKSGIAPENPFPFTQRVLASIENENEWNKLQKRILFHLKSITLWSQVNNFKFVNLELETIKKLSQKYQRPFYYRESVIKAASIINKDEKYLESFRVIYQNLDISVIGQDIKNLLFPKVYLDKIKKYSKTVDPIVILSLIRQESAFNPSAISSAGARGLMQVMPQTAKSINSKIKKKDLFKSEKSIQIGTKYFEKLLNIYKGNIIYSLAAYNAGPRRVRQWERDYFSRMDDNLLKIESIPFKETRNYVKLIYRNLFNYEDFEQLSKSKFITMLSN
ncbi:MAG: lytic transglycosylase domain-containing protein, partial [Bdellovibrionales bacterium]|nr:lytic transglycosylase domain-containing protein [Bdellovibrionales bacterium]